MVHVDGLLHIDIRKGVRQKIKFEVSVNDLRIAGVGRVNSCNVEFENLL